MYLLGYILNILDKICISLQVVRLIHTTVADSKSILTSM